MHRQVVISLGNNISLMEQLISKEFKTHEPRMHLNEINMLTSDYYLLSSSTPNTVLEFALRSIRRTHGPDTFASYHSLSILRVYVTTLWSAIHERWQTPEQLSKVIGLGPVVNDQCVLILEEI